MTTTVELLHVELDQPTITVEPGGAPVVAHIAIHNQSRIVDRYTVQVGGLDPRWFTVSSSTLSLFPDDTEQIELRIQPPVRRSDLRAGSYPFVITVRSASSDTTSTVGGEVVIRGDAIFRIGLLPQRRTSRGRGRFTVRVSNTGLAPARIAFEARDTEDACQFRFRDDQSPLIEAGEAFDLPLDVTPTRRPLVGRARTYDFTVTGTPERVDGLTEPLVLSGQLVHQPWFSSLAWLWRAARWSVVPIVVFAAFQLVPLQLRCAIPGNGPDVMVLGDGCPRPSPTAPAPVVSPAPVVPVVPQAQVAQVAAQPTQADVVAQPTPAVIVPPTPTAAVEPVTPPTGDPAQVAQLPNPQAQAAAPQAQPAQATPPQPAPAQQPLHTAPATAPQQQQAAPPVPAQAQAQQPVQTQRQQPATPQVQQPVQAQAQQPPAAQAQQLKPTFDVFATACGPDALKRPTAIVVDRQGNVFVSDTDNNRIVKLTPSGVCLDQWAVEKPTRFALDTQGTVVYLADMANNRIRKLNLQTRKLDVFVGNGHQFGQVDRPAGILVNNDNTIVVADSGNDRVQELSAQGKSLRQWTVKGASDVALETDGEVYASGTGANTNQTTVWKLTRDGKASMIFASDRALEITSDTGGTVFGSTTTDLRKLQDDGQAQTVKLLLPTGLAQPPSFAFDQRGTLYLVNAATGQILTMR